MFAATRTRDVGGLKAGPRAFQTNVFNSLSLVERLQRTGILEGHQGCVNTVGFSECGQLLISGSDDKQIIIWNWYTGTQVLSYSSGHHNNIFQARFLPHTNSNTVVSCAADGQVRVGHVNRQRSNRTETQSLATHGSRAHKLALDPETPQCFYSCGEDGRVFHYDLRCSIARHSMLSCNYGSSAYRTGRLSLNSIHCNPLQPWQFVVGGSDIFARVYDSRCALVSIPTGIGPKARDEGLVRKLAPKGLRSEHKQFASNSACHITCAVFSQKGEVLATYNDENIHLFASEGPSVRQHSQSHTTSGIRKRSARSPSEAGNGLCGAAGSPKRRPDVIGAETREDGEQLPGTANLERPAVEPGGTGWSLRQNDSRRIRRNEAVTTSGPPPEDDSQPSRAGFIGWERRAGHIVHIPGSIEEGPSSANGLDAEAQIVHRSNPGSQPSYVEERASSYELTTPGRSDSDSQSSAEDGDWDSDSTEIPLLDWSSSDSGPRIEGENSLDRLSDSMLDRQTSSDEEGGLEESDDGMAEVGAVVMESSEREAILNGGQGASKPNLLANFDDEVVMTYSGHRNNQTVKGVSFLGEDDEFVMSGSDDGHIYIWSTRDGILRQWLKGDRHVVNCLEPHPCQPLAFATSGIDDDVKLWAPSAAEGRGVPEKAQAVMERNRGAQGPRRMPTGSARSILLRLHQLAQSRDTRRLPGFEPPYREQRGAAEARARAAQEGDAREALSAHASIRQEFEGGEDDPEYTPGDCVIA